MATQRQSTLCMGFDYPSTPDGGFWLTAVGTWSIQSTYARNSGKGLRLEPAANQAYAQKELDDGAGTTTNLFNQFYIYFVTFPNASVPLYSLYRTAGGDWRLGIHFNSATNRMRAYSIGTDDSVVYGSDGDAISTGVWYRVDFKCASGTVDWYLATDNGVGVAQPQAANAQATYSPFSAILGNLNTNCTGDWVYDDCTQVVGGVGNYPSFPMKAGRVAYISTDGDGTHNNASHFTDDAANSPPAANAYLRLDEGPSSSTTDYVYQSTFNSASYLEFGLANLPTGIVENRLHAGVMRVSRSSPAGAALEASTGKAWSADDSATFGNAVIGSTTTGTKTYKTVGLSPVGGDEADWNFTKVDNSVVRVGFETDPGGSYGEQYIHDIHEEWGLIEQVGADHWAWAEGTDDMDSWQVIG